MKLDRVTMEPGNVNGAPCVRGLGLTVRRVLELLALYPDRAELRQQHPELQDDDLRQVLEYAALHLPDQTFALDQAGSCCWIKVCHAAP